MKHLTRRQRRWVEVTPKQQIFTCRFAFCSNMICMYFIIISLQKKKKKIKKRN